jgi:outer membrane protein
MRDARCGCAALFAVMWVAVICASTAASADPLVTLPAPPFIVPPLPSVTGEWTVTIGADARVKPDFEGANRYMVAPIPIFSIRRAGTAEPFRGPRDSAGATLVDLVGLSAGPVGKIVMARDAADFRALTGLGNVATAYEIGGFVQYFPAEWFRARAELRQGFGGHHGLVADFFGDFIVPLSPQWTLSGGPRATLESTAAVAPYFGINAAQAAASGLPAFDAKGGLHSAGAGVQLRYRIDPQWEVHSYVEYQRLVGGAADSPLVMQRGSPDQVAAGIGVSYSFDIGVR